MSETLVIAIFTLAGTIIGALVGPLVVARFAKPKQERDAAFRETYLKLADMSADQLQERMDLIITLDSRLRETEDKLAKQERENERLKEYRAERDEQIEALQSGAKALKTQNEKDAKEIAELRKKYEDDLQETQRLRNEYATAKKQLLRVEDLAISLGEYVDKIKTAVQAIPGIDLPLNGELMESVLRLKAEKAARGK